MTHSETQMASENGHTDFGHHYKHGGSIMDLKEQLECR